MPVAGCNPYTGHCVRVGTATVLLKLGLPESSIK